MNRPLYMEFAWAYDLLTHGPVASRVAFIVDQLRRHVRRVVPDSWMQGAEPAHTPLHSPNWGFNITGIDASSEMIAEAKRKSSDAVGQTSRRIRCHPQKHRKGVHKRREAHCDAQHRIRVAGNGHPEKPGNHKNDGQRRHQGLGFLRVVDSRTNAHHERTHHQTRDNEKKEQLEDEGGIKKAEKGKSCQHCYSHRDI